jgi:tetratricopeptide (TPR) repeat protein
MTEDTLAFLQGTALLREGRAIEAVPHLEQAYELHPDDVDVAINLSGAYILTKKFKRAVRILEPATDQAPDHAMAWINLGAAYLGNPVLARDEDQKRAIAAFECALAIDPAAHSVAYNIGLIYRDRREKGEAIYWLRQAVEHNPQDRDAKRLLDRLEAA